MRRIFIIFIFSFLDFQNTVLKKLASLQKSNEQILLNMQEILRYSKKTALDNLIDPENIPEFPLKTYEDYQNFEKLITEDRTIYQFMVSYTTESNNVFFSYSIVFKKYT